MKATSGIVFLAVLITIVFSLVVASASLDDARTAYRVAHNIEPEKMRSFLGKEHIGPGKVTLRMLGWQTVLIDGVGLGLLYAVIHTIIGRLIATLGHGLWRANMKTYSGEDEVWGPNGAMIFGAMWPLTVFLIPILLLALLMGALYQLLWR